MRIRQARKVIETAHCEQRQPTGRVMRAMRTIWHRSRFENGRRMGGGKQNNTIKLMAEILTGRIKVDSYGRPTGETH